jgi:hypothetical protein
VTRVRIFSLDDLSASDLALSHKDPPERDEEPEDGAAVRIRQREITAIRTHVFLDQTLPPSSPLVRETERRRSGGEGK